MNDVSLSSYRFISKSMLSKSMAVSLACSLLAHVTAFAFSYNWDISAKEKYDQPLLVELIDLPIKREDPGKKYGRKVVKNESGVNSGSPWTPASETKDTNLSSLEAEATVSLDSQDLKYVSYLSTIKKKIEPRWNYPESAQKIGLQGKLALYFSIVLDGHLAKLELLNSSGHTLLDEEALKAVRGAAPYYPLPERLEISRLNILATFEYRISPYSMSSFSQSSKGKSL